MNGSSSHMCVRSCTIHLGLIAGGNVQKIRTVFYLDKTEREALERISIKSGAPLSELMRRAVVAYLKVEEKKK